MKQNTTDIIGITLFIIFMEASIVPPSELLEGVVAAVESFTLNHWVRPERIGIRRAPITRRMAPLSRPLLMIFNGESAIFRPRK